ncbi:hypothetical protein FMEXI_12020 [Fusarium mexicanum]|uniref:Uncharacterized protein n=1 Tax=Fusarium mexicanum TaxID=751941 RepID=A0A8H5I9N6_9HYPO|nr:hypothetical protein FMEXI_12020 [Fusarium mexicanum]
MSSGVMPGSWDNESPSTTKTHEDYERDIEARKGTAQRDLKEFHHSREIFNILSSSGESHVFSLQPCRKDLTPAEVRQVRYPFSVSNYTPLFANTNLKSMITMLLQKLMNPWMEDCDDDAHAFLTHAKRHIADGDRFERILRKYSDLMNGLNFPETDEDIVTSVILRYLHVRVFQSVLYDAIPRSVQAIAFIENHMRASVEPKRDHFTVRTWTAEAYNTLLSCPQFKPVRQRTANDMAVQLSDILRIFSQEDNLHNCYQDLIDVVVYPAIRLYEKLQVSTNHLYLDINSLPTSVGGERHPKPKLADSLMRLDCKNVLQNRKGFNLRKLDPPPSEEDLYHSLHSVCTVVPALYVRQAKQGDTLKNPIVIRKQQVLVAWSSGEQRRAYQDNGRRTLISHLFALKSSEDN